MIGVINVIVIIVWTTIIAVRILGMRYSFVETTSNVTEFLEKPVLFPLSAVTPDSVTSRLAGIFRRTCREFVMHKPNKNSNLYIVPNEKRIISMFCKN